MASREDNVYMAKLSEQAERYDEMVEAVRRKGKKCVGVFWWNGKKWLYSRTAREKSEERELERLTRNVCMCWVV